MGESWDDTPQNGWKEQYGFDDKHNDLGESDTADPAANISKHANDHDSAYADRGPMLCHNCNKPGHKANECSEPKKLTGECYNCREVGHNKVDCPNPKVERPFTGECRYCHQEGHRAIDCPEKLDEKCKNSQQQGHRAVDCENARVIDRSNVPDVTAVEAWEMLKRASDEQDKKKFQEGVGVLTKAVPTLNYVDIEKDLRQKGLKLYLIAMDNACPKSMTRVNLQGRIDCDYTVEYFLTEKPRRPGLTTGWPSSPEVNLERLNHAGEAMPHILPRCFRCEQLGHTSQKCSLPPPETFERQVQRCSNCGSESHRLRECPEERKHGARASGGAIECRRCNETGHIAKNCPNAGTGGADGCRNCGEEGHFAKECGKPRKTSIMTCHNCDEVGHMSRDCLKPRDWSRVKCQNCGEMGHGKARCPQPTDDNEAGFNASDDNLNSFDAESYSNGASINNPSATVQGGWDNIPTTGGW